LFITENGTSSYVVGLLSQEQVLETKSNIAVADTATYKEEITSGSVENLHAVHKYLKNKYSHNGLKELWMLKKAKMLV
tara:strand:- start:43 stop:276 length:234 start_codon:yes stop_codon:yes gene_type:complete